MKRSTVLTMTHFVFIECYAFVKTSNFDDLIIYLELPKGRHWVEMCLKQEHIKS